MAKMLCRDLTFTEQMALANLAQHPGFDVLVKILDDTCRQAAAEPVKVDPLDKDYAHKVTELTRSARMVNDFCASVRASVNTHISAAVMKQNEDQLQAQMEQDAERVLTTVRRLAQKDNTE